MSRCKQCNIEILEPTERCPLCNSVLEKSEDLEAIRRFIRRQGLLP